MSVNRLQPATMTTFVGGLNLHNSQFQLDPNESPDLLNVDVDPRGGFTSRRGWRRWNDVDIIDIGGGNEVWIGPTDPQPANPTVELWFDGAVAGTGVNNNEVFVGPSDPATDYPSIELWVVADTAGGLGGGNEVWVGTDDPLPANPNVELWVDTTTLGGGPGPPPLPGTTSFMPRNAFSHNRVAGQALYVTHNHNLYRADQTRVFTELLSGQCNAEPHMADFAAWGEQMYVVLGYADAPVRYEANLTETVLTTTPFSEVDDPVFDVMPAAQQVRGHAGYMFVGNISEAGVNYPNRIRWSHPNRPDAWRDEDFLDIEIGGGKITGMLSFRDHLLIFKTNSLWALYGYDESSWQLTKVSAWIGAPCSTATTASETAVYFYSANDVGGIYGYTGEAPTHLSENLSPAFEDITAYENVFVSWAGRRLWVSVPWIKDSVKQRALGPPVRTTKGRHTRRAIGSSTEWPTTLFVADPDIGKGAWTMYMSPHGAVAPVIDGSDVDASYPLGFMWSTYLAIAVSLDTIEDSYDDLMQTAIHEEFDSFYRTPWMNMNQPDTLKSWKRPRLICPRVPRDTEVIIETFHDYDETFARRTRTITIPSLGSAYWTAGGANDVANDGFDWTELGADDPRGADWGAEHIGSVMIRGGSMGVAAAVQMRFSRSPNTTRRKWGVDAVVIKPIGRRERT